MDGTQANKWQTDRWMEIRQTYGRLMNGRQAGIWSMEYWQICGRLVLDCNMADRQTNGWQSDGPMMD